MSGFRKSAWIPRLILASGSPRRQDYLCQMGFSFEVIPSKVDESTIDARQPGVFALKAAYAKAVDVAGTVVSPALVIAADTIVIWQGRRFGKPQGREDARRMLRDLSGKTHSVVTAIAIAQAGKPNALMDREETRVIFHELDEATIEDYLDTGEPFDKAGGYGIQGAGGKLIRAIEGDYHNVVGVAMRSFFTDAWGLHGCPRI